MLVNTYTCILRRRSPYVSFSKKLAIVTRNQLSVCTDILRNLSRALLRSRSNARSTRKASVSWVVTIASFGMARTTHHTRRSASISSLAFVLKDQIASSHT